MSLKVAGHRVLVKPDPVHEQTAIPEKLKESGFQVAMDVELSRRMEVATQIGTVVGVGPTAWRMYDGSDPNWTPWCNVGDRVIFARYAGKIIEDPVTLEKFMILNDEDIQCVVTGEKSVFDEE